MDGTWACVKTEMGSAATMRARLVEMHHVVDLYRDEQIMLAETLPKADPERIRWRRKTNIDHQAHEEFGN